MMIDDDERERDQECIMAIWLYYMAIDDHIRLLTVNGERGIEGRGERGWEGSSGMLRTIDSEERVQSQHSTTSSILYSCHRTLFPTCY